MLQQLEGNIKSMYRAGRQSYLKTELTQDTDCFLWAFAPQLWASHQPRASSHLWAPTGSVFCVSTTHGCHWWNTKSHTGWCYTWQLGQGSCWEAKTVKQRLTLGICVLNKRILQWPLSNWVSCNTPGHSGTLGTYLLLGVGLVLLQ